MTYVHKFEMNTKGRDFVVGDIHGNFSKLMAVLKEVNFSLYDDRLFSVGDLVDRGPENEDMINFTESGIFFPVRGNHDDFAIRYHRIGKMDDDHYRRNGGGWFIDLVPEMREILVQKLERLPFAIEVETINGRVGIIHADVPCPDWNDLEQYLANKGYRQRAMWARDRFGLQDDTPVSGIDHVVVGHNCHPTVMTLGNVHHIDTGGWLPEDYFGRFTLLEISKPGVF
ncbi:metallophosphoesterase [Advenella mimigardefordensis]|nr:metallophosphoesterase [Advenella mimigardefordensis]